MIAHSLRRVLEPVAQRYRRWRLWRGLALSWFLAALVGGALLWWHRETGWGSPRLAWWLGAAAGVAGVVVGWRLLQWQPDWRSLARQIEARHPDLRNLLLTAVEQQPDPRTQEFNYLQDRVLCAACEEGSRGHWLRTVPGVHLFGMQLAQWASLGLLLACLAQLHTLKPGPARVILARGVTVTPGDTTVEKGSGLVVLARFNGRLPSEVALIIGSSANSTRVPLAKILSDPVFGGSIADVQSNLTYYVEYAGQRTRDYSVRVFEYPRLERMDAQIAYPAYTGLPEKRIEDTRRVSAVEGSRLELSGQLNKPVASAKLIGKDRSVVPLTTDLKRAAVTLTNFPLVASQTYELQLIDAEGRTNRLPTQLVVAVLSNRPPELKLIAPKGDQRVSALEEMAFRAEVSDDFGLKAYGLAYTVAGQETKTITLGQTSGPLEKRQFNYLLPMEDLHVSAEQLISYYLWAEDIGPDGQVRRSTGDLFFAEVRPFDEVFRQSQSASPDSANQPNESGEQGGAESTARLAELQKQIIMATWRLQRMEKGPAPSAQYRQDAPVVRQSQEQALNQARAAKAEATDLKAQASYETVEQAMSQALAHLAQATNSPAALPDALVDEQAAYQALLKLQAREYQVSQGRNQRNQRNSRNSGARSQQQLQQLEMAASENRYETERQAARPTTPQKSEDLQVQNRLKELAQRQQDVNERLKELQTALQEARTAAEREAARQQLKRLREEEQQMLADMDELQQRMDRSQNPTRMADARQQLEQSRAEVQRAAEAMQNESVPQALTSGVRAERQLQELRDNLRQQNATQFNEEMRQLRSDARSLAQRQDEVGNRMRELADPQRKVLSLGEQRTVLAEQMTRQKRDLTNLLERATEITRQAETAEPLLSKKLYDTVRQTQQDKLENLLDLSTEMLRRSFVPQASQIEERARQGVTRLRRGVEQAADSVLGDEAEALRLARRELDDLARQVEREAAQFQSNAMANLVAAGSAGMTNRSGNATNAEFAALFAPGNRGTNATERGQRGQNRLGQNSDNPAQNPGNRQGQAGSGQNPATQNQRRAQAGNRAPAGNRSQETPLRNPGDPEGGINSGGGWTGPITGPDFVQWSDRLRDVEEMLDFPDWRREVARIRDRAQTMRVEFKRRGAAPQWSLVQTQIVAPLAEVRSRIQEELARRENKDGLVPLDRDPVPNRFSEMVRRYYEDLGRDN